MIYLEDTEGQVFDLTLVTAINELVYLDLCSAMLSEKECFIAAPLWVIDEAKKRGAGRYNASDIMDEQPDRNPIVAGLRSALEP